MKYYGILVYGSDTSVSPDGHGLIKIDGFPFTDNKQRALQSLQSYAKRNPGQTVHLMETSYIANSQPGPVEVLLVNDKGEVLPV